MLNFARALTAVAPALLLVAALSCGTERVGPTSLDSISREQLLVDLDALTAPDGASAADFAALKGALRTALAESAEDVFEVHPPRGPGSVVTDLTRAILPDGSPGIQWTYVNPGDYNFDGQANLNDLVHVGAFLGSHTGRSDWERAQHADGDGNGMITLADITPLAANFLGTVTAWQVEGAAGESGDSTPITQVPFAASEPPKELYAPQYMLAPGQHFAFYRVVALDPEGAQGAASSLSQQGLLAPGVRVLGNSQQPEFVSREGDTITLALPFGVSLQAGEILLLRAVDGAASEGGFAMRADEIVADGAQVQTKCSPVPIADVLATGSIRGIFGPTDPSFRALEPTRLRPAPGVEVTFAGNCDFLSWGSFAASFTEHKGLQCFRSRLSGDLGFRGNLKVKAEGSVQAATGDDHSAELLIAQFENLGSTEREQGSMFWMPFKTTYDIYLGAKLSGDAEGSFDMPLDCSFVFADAEIAYSAATSSWSRTISVDSIENWPSSERVFSGHGNAVVETYLRIEAKVTVLPGAGGAYELPDLTLALDSHVTESWQETQLPESGFDYQRFGSVHGRMRASLARFGYPSSTLDAALSSEPTLLEDGFAAQSQPAGFTVSGTVRNEFELTPVPGVTVRLLEQSGLQELDSVQTNAEGRYSFDSVAAGTAVRVVPELEGYIFTPNWAEFVVNSDLGQDFTAWFNSEM